LAGLPGYLVPLHTAAGPATHAGQQCAQPPHLPLRQALDHFNNNKDVLIFSFSTYRAKINLELTVL
jgi:hypothetical protein